jgi:kumamolisin
MNKPFAKSHIRRFADIKIVRPHARSLAYEPGVNGICQAYGWPSGISVVPLTIVIGELGGKFYPSDVTTWAARAGLPAPTVITHLLPGADDSAGDADGEVALDWQRAAESWSYLTGLPANIVLAYGPNTGQAFADVGNYAQSLPNVGALPWSWGAPEDTWASQDMAAVNQSAQSSLFPWLAASGDNNSNDGEGNPVTDFPSCSPYGIGCGGTTLPRVGSEIVWNNGSGEGTGGGFSKIYQRPVWQPVNSKGTGRMDPDLACNADPNTGYDTLVNGQWEPIGGTSAVAPLMGGVFAVVNGARLKAGKPMLNGQAILALMWQMQNCFFDITNGNNGAYSATTGPDPCSGIGRPLGTLVSALIAGTVTPPGGPPGGPPPATMYPLIRSVNLPAITAGRTYRMTFQAAGNVPAGPANVDAIPVAGAATVEAVE